jgi:penicillin-binding protein 1A
MNNSNFGSAGRPRRPKKASSGPTGKKLKVNSTLGDRRRATKHARATSHAIYLSTLPKNRWKRILYRLHPKRVFHYWFSRQGGIMALKITGIGIVVCFFLIIGVFAYFRKDLPKINDLSGDKLGGSITYYDRTGQTVLWEDYDAVKRIPVAEDKISEYIKQATVAIEDKNFYSHGAFDVTGIARAGYNDVFGGGGTIQGGSTITQQLVKLDQEWTNDRTITRKVKELILAVELEREYSKKEILSGYLNLAPYGGNRYGIETAAQDYFGTTAKDLTLAQAAFLAGIPQKPTAYSPYSSPLFNSAVTEDRFREKALLARQHYILDQMVDQKMISKQQAEDAKKVDIISQIHPMTSKYNGIKAPYFVLAAKDQLNEKFGSETARQGGWKVITTLDMDKQAKVEKQIQDNMRSIQRNAGDSAAMVVEDVPTGQVVALVGGSDFNNNEYGKLNFAKHPISPGSSFKPYDYVTLINDKEANAGAGSVIYDNQQPLEGWPCTNKGRPINGERKQGQNCLFDYDFRYPGPLTIRYALGGSRNVPAVKAMLMQTPAKVIDTAEMLMNGSTTSGYGYNCFKDVAQTIKIPCRGASAIGDGAYIHLDEHVHGLATLSRMGRYLPQTYILKVVKSDKKVLDEWTQEDANKQAKQVVSPDAAYILNDMLSDPNASYFRALKFQHQKNGWHFAVKTGTTNFSYDGLMVSYSTRYAAGVWIGHHTRQVALKTSPENITGPIMRGFMESVHSSLPAANWKQPATVKVAPAYVIRSHVGLGSVEPSPANDLYPGWYKPPTVTRASVTIDKVSGKVATSCTPEAARQTSGNANHNIFSVDRLIGTNGRVSEDTTDDTANVSTATDDVHNCNDAKPVVTITPPAAGKCSSTDNNGRGCAITTTISQGTHPLGGSQYGGTVVFNVNGSDTETVNINTSPSTVTFYYKPTANGTVNVRATVTDSVLYQSSDSATITTAVPSTPGSGSGNNTGNGNNNSGGGNTFNNRRDEDRNFGRQLAARARAATIGGR